MCTQNEGSRALKIVYTLGVAGLALLTPGSVAGLVPELVAPHNNVLVIIGDDVGIDVLRAYDPDTLFGISDLPPTPAIDGLAEDGVLFTNAWANPVCCPTRATVLTGRYGFRTGLLHLVPRPPNDPGNGLDLDYEWPIPRILHEILGSNGVATAAFGKWHLSTGPPGDPDLYSAPNRAGFSHYAGVLFNLYPPSSYFHWQKIVDGAAMWEDRYATTANVDDALEWILPREQEGEAWFVWLAFNAPHPPFHKPPDALHTRSLEAVHCTDEPRPCYLAMLEAMDTETERLLNELGSLPGDVLGHTTVIFFGDNGTPRETTVAPFDSLHAKETLYEGGVHVPLIVSGYGVDGPGRVSDALVNVTDIFATVFDLFLGTAHEDYVRGALPSEREIDARSLMPLLRDEATDIRTFTLAEARTLGTSGKAIRNLSRAPGGAPEESHKLIRFEGYYDTTLTSLQSPEMGRGFYELISDPFEEANLYPGGISQENVDSYVSLCETLQELIGFDPPMDCSPPEESSRPLSGAGGPGKGARLLVYPNPTLGGATFVLRERPAPPRGDAVLRIYGVDGRAVREVWRGNLETAPDRFVWDGRGDEGRPVASGLYIARLEAAGRPFVSHWVAVLR